MLDWLQDLYQFEEENGYREAELQACEQRLGLPLPPVWRSFLLRYGKDDLLNSYNYFVTPTNLDFFGSDWLCLAISNQAVSSWAIKRQDFTKEKCTVYCSLDNHQFLEDDSLENFLVKWAYTYHELIFPHRIQTTFQLADLDILRAAFGQEKSVTEYPGSSRNWYFWQEPTTLVLASVFRKYYRLSIFSHQPQALEAFRLLFPTRSFEQLPDLTTERKSRRRLIRFDDELAELKTKQVPKQLGPDNGLPF